MLATNNSDAERFLKLTAAVSRSRQRARSLLPALWLALAPTAALAGATVSADAKRVQDAEQLRVANEHRDAQVRRAQATNDVQACWRLGRACFDMAELAPGKSGTERFALEGIAACRLATRLASNSAPSHYYLALNLGQLARVKGLSALKLVREMEGILGTSRELDPGWDHAGADRTLGLLYRDAPGWPISVGSRSKARQHLLRAVQTAPDYPENQLCLLESLSAWNELQAAGERLDAARQAIDKARGQLTGERWAAAWLDWDPRWENVRAKIEAGLSRRQASRPGR